MQGSKAKRLVTVCSHHYKSPLSIFIIQGILRGGATVNAVLNYKLTPALSTEVCLTNSIRVKNCIGIYQQWANNKILLDVWYQSKKCKKKRRIFPVKQIIVTQSLCT